MASDDETSALLAELTELKFHSSTDDGPVWLSSAAEVVSPSRAVALSNSGNAKTDAPLSPDSKGHPSLDDHSSGLPSMPLPLTGPLSATTMRPWSASSSRSRGTPAALRTEKSWNAAGEESTQRGMEAGFTRVGVSEKEAQIRILDTLERTDLFAPLLGGARIMGRATVSSVAFSTAPGEMEVRLEDKWGNFTTGGNGKRSHVDLRFDTVADGKLGVTVVRAVNLPLLDRFASSNPQVSLRLGACERRTRVVRDSVEPVFRERLELRWPPSPPDSPLIIQVAHADRHADVAAIAKGSHLEELRPGDVLFAVGARMRSLLFLESGTLAVLERSQGPNDSGGGRERHVEVGRLSHRGVGLGAHSLLCGRAMPVTVMALTRCTLVRTPRDALAEAMRHAPSLCEYLAHTLLDVDAPNAGGGAVDVTVTVRSLVLPPDGVVFDYTERSPVVLLELDGERRETRSLRFFLPEGELPSWEQSFSFSGAFAPGALLHISLVVAGPHGELLRLAGRTSLSVADLKAHREFEQELDLEDPAEDETQPGKQRRSARAGDDRPLLHAAASQRLKRYVESEGAEGLLEAPWEDPGIEALKGGGLFAGFRRQQRAEVSSKAESEDDEDDGNDNPSQARDGQDVGLQPSRDKLVRRRTEGGVLRLQVQVCGDYAPGERELLQVLRLMGFARDFKGLYAGGVRSVADLLQGLDDQRLVIACPDMKRARRRLFLERLHALRAEGFLSPGARELAAAIRQARPCPRESPSCGITPRVRPLDEEAEFTRSLLRKFVE